MSEYFENDGELLQRVMLEVDQGFDSSIRLQTEFFRFRDDVQGQAATLAEFRKLAERLYDILVALLSLSVSDDGRQSQLAKVRLFNEDSQSPRNLFVKSRQVFIIHNEHKHCREAGGDNGAISTGESDRAIVFVHKIDDVARIGQALRKFSVVGLTPRAAHEG